MENSNINLLELYVESGIDESYNDNPFNFFDVKKSL